MEKRDIDRYLSLLGQELALAGRTGKILLVGGAVMVLVVGNRTSTRDIDASFEQEAGAIRAAVNQIARREGLPPDWLNDGAKGFLYSPPPIILWKQYPGLEVYLPTLDYLLAMKLVAGRPADIADAKALIRYAGFSDPQQVLAILQQYIPSRYLTVRVQYTVEELFEP
ncbi:MAG: nucleotidyl transferase [Ktedonobacteraceae bacterium]|nr:nucleotidyl transferase [Ktedonobacteraceae bacterium]